MRAKLGPLLRAGGGLLACGYIILIAVRGQLGFYIHPRYHLLAVVATVAGGMLLLIDIVLQLRHNLAGKRRASARPAPTKHPKKPRRTIPILSIVTAGILVLSSILPPRPLSSSSAANRATSGPTSTTGRCDKPEPLNGKPVSMNRWRSAFDDCPNDSFFDGVTIDVTGFVARDPGGFYDNRYFELSRFVISCCAVDSTPVSILVKSPDAERYRDNQWLQIRGQIKRELSGGKAVYVLTNPTITPTTEPTNPYEFLGV
ncbi:TIGR03943 family protein [Candidatus Saccharibacteria bacterium oral taxon 488]|nr:TIGR03943 family protein [Candidatus Saccharibacteria bacterium oral taxon 488]